MPVLTPQLGIIDGKICQRTRRWLFDRRATGKVENKAPSRMFHEEEEEEEFIYHK